MTSHERRKTDGGHAVLKIAIVVHGRFHAFDLARELIALGHDVTLFTNYPGPVAERFGIPRQCVRTFLTHGVATRIVARFDPKQSWETWEAFSHKAFGRWAARKLKQERWDVIHCWSGISEELLTQYEGAPPLTLLMRGSSHIRTQARLLREEEERTGVPQDGPSAWMIEREVREYSRTGIVSTLSSFARMTFLDEGIEQDRLAVLLCGVDVKAFRPDASVVRERCARIRSGAPLRILNVGTLSFQKGAWDYLRILPGLAAEGFQVQFVGPIADECKGLVQQLDRYATFLPSRPQTQLPEAYAWGDVFLLPTIQDGFALVLAQAAASALPVITTTNSGGPDIVKEGRTGWITPIRDPDSILERLQWCHDHREQLAEMVEATLLEFQPRDWRDVALDFERLTYARLSG